MTANGKMMTQMSSKDGFIAALDQSGGSTPGALRLYGVPDSAYSGDAEMFKLIHEMRVQIITAPAFTGAKVIGAILFERTMDGEARGEQVPTFLWKGRGVVPFLKVDKGLEAEKDGVSLMKPMPDLDPLLARAVKLGVFGTKMRSVINLASKDENRRDCQATVRRRRPDRRARARPDHRARGLHQEPEQGRGREHSPRRDLAQARRAAGGSSSHAQADHPGRAEFLYSVHQAPARRAGCCAFGRLHSGPGLPAPRQESWDGGELLARPRAGSEAVDERRRIQCGAGLVDRRNLQGVDRQGVTCAAMQNETGSPAGDI